MTTRGRTETVGAGLDLGGGDFCCYGDVSNRLFALFFDCVILSAVVFVGVLVVSLFIGPTVTFDRGSDSLFQAVDVHHGRAVIDACLSAALTFVYFAGFWCRFGATPGYRFLGMRLRRRLNGDYPNLGAAFRRWLVLFAPFSFVAVIASEGSLGGVEGVLYLMLLAWYFLLLVTTARNHHKRGLHDRFSGAVVLKAATPVLEESLTNRTSSVR